ncbi:hypothetical protein LPJ64_006217 [Coemansia asiatica]|uniref:VanZ-like domain-containing protein n=1 Tax=Coemansia asiatica TaxID=1052880 RepID=A0A9W7XFI6_9FUNG|nr:hypothetical protein LPJ64_006217 [Coemansia asiatica]KAJ2881485.1 hypothetical protein FB639_002604 [Coemansia asiatica]
MNGLRLGVVASLIAWMLFLAVLGFTRLIVLPVSDKAQHFIGFGVMGVLVFFSFQPTVPRRKAWRITALTMGVVCFLSEVLQWLFTSRPFEWADIVANYLGASTFLFAAWMADKWILQMRVRRHGGASGDSPRYWMMAPGGHTELETAMESFEMEDELDVELDEILVDTPPPSRPPPQPATPQQNQG